MANGKVIDQIAPSSRLSLHVLGFSVFTFGLSKEGICCLFICIVYIYVKKIAFGNKEHTTDQKIGVSVLLRLFISSNGVCNTAYAL